MDILCPILFLVALIGVGLAWNWFRRFRANRAWKKFAAEHDFEFVEPGFFGNYEMSGTYGGVSARIYTESRGPADDSTPYTVYRASLPDGFPADLLVVEEGMFSGVQEMLGYQDIQVGDPVVDDAFVIRGERPSEVQRFFERPGVMEAFRGLAGASRSIQIREGGAQLDNRGLETNRDVIATGLNTVTHFARNIQQALDDEFATEW